MTEKPSPSLQTEMTPEGEQIVMPGVTPIGEHDRLRAFLDAPLVPRCPQKPLNIGLFDEDARRQFDLF